MEEENKTVIQRIQELEGKQNDKKRKKPKFFRLPFRSRLTKGNLMKGYITVLIIYDNNAIEFKKHKIQESTIKLDDTYHAVDGRDILTYKGKPFIILPKKRKNPYNPNRQVDETYGQKHIMSRMTNETLKFAKKIGGIGISIGALIIVGVIAYALVTG